ncbi:TPA: hypothetical protein HA239_02250 [Candidatus Woesearchaeota archaeon]|nr:V-type ATP synthase subunit E [archaeon GW2011_AR15]MBS3104475.1 hypothetical protein [Candidatus Woesearchaeota archaeon]HIH41211.1 hypothetical protein [Candidatus Woesearchaeota archaeon]
MGINEVKKEILDNAGKEASRILAEAGKEEKEIVGSIASAVKQSKEKQEKDIKRTVEQYRSSVLSEAESAVKKERLSLEKKIISKVFSSAAEKLGSLSQKKREQHLNRLSKKIKELGYPTVYCSLKDQKHLKKYSPKAADILGGIVLENKQGDTRVDLSYDMLLEEVKKEEMSAIVRTLFA